MANENNLFYCRGIHLTHLNIRSLWQKHSLIKNYLTYNKITPFGISESWLTHDHTNNILSIKGSNLYRNDRKWNDKQSPFPKKGGGICCYVSDDTIVSSHELSHLNVSTIDIEILWFTFEHPRMKKICLANLYRPPQGNIKRFCDKLEEQLLYLKEKYNTEPEIFVMGDSNKYPLKPIKMDRT